MRIRDFAWEYLGACIALAILSGLFLAVLNGCAERPIAPQQSGGAGVPPSAAASLGHLGATCTWIGGIALVAGIVVRLAAIPFPLLAFAAPFAGVAAFAGSLCLVCGLAFQWLAGHLWLLAVVVLVGGAAALWLHWRHLRPDADRLLAQARNLVPGKPRVRHLG